MPGRGARSTTALPVTQPRYAPPQREPAVDRTWPRPRWPPRPRAVQEAFAEAAAAVTPYLHDTGLELAGVAPLREAIAERYCARGLPTDPDQIMVTTGALHAIGLILATYVQPGDRVLVEQPTYHGALSAISHRRRTRRSRWR